MKGYTRVLVVDDEPALLRLLRVTLEGEGYEVLLASDGRTALQRIRSEQPDIVLLDIMMPVVDGWGVLEGLRSEERRPRVICLTAKESRRDRLRGWRLGADEYVTKPFGVDHLLEVMTDVLERTPDERESRRTRAVEELEDDLPPPRQ